MKDQINVDSKRALLPPVTNINELPLTGNSMKCHHPKKSIFNAYIVKECNQTTEISKVIESAIYMYVYNEAENGS